MIMAVCSSITPNVKIDCKAISDVFYLVGGGADDEAKLYSIYTQYFIYYIYIYIQYFRVFFFNKKHLNQFETQ